MSQNDRPELGTRDNYVIVIHPSDEGKLIETSDGKTWKTTIDNFFRFFGRKVYTSHKINPGSVGFMDEMTYLLMYRDHFTQEDEQEGSDET